MNISNNIQSKPVSHKRTYLILLAFLAITLMAVALIGFNLSWRPDVTELPPDSGFYAYVGKAILHGQLLYGDIWDNKPPFGYLLNAVGMLLFGQTSWGVWWSSVVWMLGCSVLLFLIIKKIFGWIPALFCDAIFLVALMNLEIFQGGNLTEIYGLAPQIGVIGLIYVYFTKSLKSWLAILIGLLTAFAFLIKQPTIVLGCSALLVMTLYAIKESNLKLALNVFFGWLAGFLSLLVITALYWLVKGAFPYFLNGAILQGFSYIGGTESNLRVNFFYTLVNILPNLYIGKLFVIALLTAGIYLLEKLYHYWLMPIIKQHLSIVDYCLVLGLIIFPLIAKQIWPSSYFGKFIAISIALLGVYILIRYFRLPDKPDYQQVFSPIDWIWLLGVISLPLEVIMVSLGGRNFGHYFLTMIPAIILTIALPVWLLINVIKEGWKFNNTGLFAIVYTLIFIAIGAWGIISFKADIPSAEYTHNLAGIFKQREDINDLENYIMQTTQTDDTVLVWHIHLGINFVTNRYAPARMLFPLNLFIPPDKSNTWIDDYLSDLESHTPELILVQRPSSISLPFVDESPEQLCDPYCAAEFMRALEVPEIYQQWLKLRQFFLKNYTLDTKIYDWIVYRRVP